MRTVKGTSQDKFLIFQMIQSINCLFALYRSNGNICYDAATNAFWIVSDESQMVIKISRTGVLLGQWSTPVNQGEGIAFIGTRMYIVSDTDAKLYVFVKPS